MALTLIERARIRMSLRSFADTLTDTLIEHGAPPDEATAAGDRFIEKIGGDVELLLSIADGATEGRKNAHRS